MLGLDLAIRTGSLIRMNIDPYHRVIDDYEVLCDWNRGPSVKDPLDIIVQFFREVVLSTIPNDETIIAADWNLNEVYWSANKKNSNIKTFIAGYISGFCAERGISVHFVSPQEVRLFFGYNQKTSKEDVHSKFLKIPYIYKGKSINYHTDHELDAAIVAYVLRHHLWGINQCSY